MISRIGGIIKVEVGGYQPKSKAEVDNIYQDADLTCI